MDGGAEECIVRVLMSDASTKELAAVRGSRGSREQAPLWRNELLG